MSGLHRALKRAEREGLPNRTESDAGSTDRLPVADAPVAAQAEAPAAVLDLADVDAESPAPVARVAQGPLSPSFVAATSPECFAAQQYRFLRTRLAAHDNGTESHVWLVTSPGSGDGKTTTSANLALTMSREFQQRVVLVEADLRRPRLASLFGLPPSPGLIDLLMGVATIEEALFEVPDQRLWLMPAGLASMPATELFASTMMHRAMGDLRKRFSRIVVDTPPAVAADTHLLTRLADSVLVVVRAGMTPRSSLARTLGVIDRRQLTGVVLNMVDTTPDEYYGYPPSESGRSASQG